MKRIFPDRPILAVGAILLINKRILLVKRKYPPDQGLWSIPGGAVKLGENLMDAVKRELNEECGISVNNGKIVFVLDKIYYTKEKKIIYHYSIIDFLFTEFKGKLRPGSDAELTRFFILGKIDRYSNISKSTLDVMQIFKKDVNLPIYKSLKRKYPDNDNFN